MKKQIKQSRERGDEDSSERNENGTLFNIEDVLSEKNVTVRAQRPVHFIPKPHRTIEWLGGVNYVNLEKVFADIKSHMRDDTHEEIHLIVNSYGGATGIGMNFHDVVNTVLRPNLVTIGSGDVDSSGIIVLLSGRRRFITKNTTLLLHLAGRTFDGGKRFSTHDMEGMLNEDKLKDYQYACVVADRISESVAQNVTSPAVHEGAQAHAQKYTPEYVLDLMARNTILTAEEAVQMGLAHGVLK